MSAAKTYPGERMALNAEESAARKPAGSVTTANCCGRRLAIVDADWLDEFKQQAAAADFKARFNSIFGGPLR